MIVTVSSSSCHTLACFCVVHTCLRRRKEEGGEEKEVEEKKDKEKKEYVTKTICDPQSMKYLLVLSDPLQKVYQLLVCSFTFTVCSPLPGRIPIYSNKSIIC